MRWFLVAVLTALAACTANPGVSYTPEDYLSSLRAVNQARAQARSCTHGSSMTHYDATNPLTWNGLLGEVARQRAEHLQQTGVLSHYEGSSTPAVAVRSQQNGYRFVEIRENLSQGDTLASDAVSAWLSSTLGHCNTLMEPHLREMGMVRRGDYWVLVVAQPQP
ncbi:MAG: CAP domain-containing protein [Meiothermus sp.]|uniref:CAP domain-containing protein n=1 Tax=Meiothermus sp. TaxID=1955249 RepID=UPI0028CCC284|nr:CAP domain-containing protein [Meiothermus sp.]MDT7919040.1 CAP domain-containing protein [Meiothermus sp.]